MRTKCRMRKLLCIAWIALLPSLFAGGNQVNSQKRPGSSQTVYVPVYSHIHSGDKNGTLNLANTLSIRNTDMTKTISVLSVNYHDSSGKLVRRYLEQPIDLAPLASTSYMVGESDASGGDTPCFIIKWQSEEQANTPIIEGVMIGTVSTQGISFVLHGQTIAE